MNYKTSEEESKWKNIAAKKINNTKRKNTPPLAPGSKEQQLEDAPEQTTTWSMVAGGKGRQCTRRHPPPSACALSQQIFWVDRNQQWLNRFPFTQTSIPSFSPPTGTRVSGSPPPPSTTLHLHPPLHHPSPRTLLHLLHLEWSRGRWGVSAELPSGAIFSQDPGKWETLFYVFFLYFFVFMYCVCIGSFTRESRHLPFIYLMQNDTI